MSFEGIIITGTSCAGKSTIANELCSNNDCFELVMAVTTREKREDDTNFEYLEDNAFDELLNKGELLVNSIYHGKKYGVKKDKYNDVIDKNKEGTVKVPILVITPEAAAELLTLEKEEKYMCFFLDAPNEVLLDRWNERLAKVSDKSAEKCFIKQHLDRYNEGFSKLLDKSDKKSFKKQHQADREYQNYAHYILETNTELSEIISLVLLLWEYKNKGGVLPNNMITSMIKCGMLLRNADLEMVKGASYDLRLGDEYYYGGKIQKLSGKNSFLTIEPYDYAIVSCKEKAWIPRDVIGKFGLKVGLFCQGMILSNGPQIDPGFRGTLFCLLFNTSNRAVHIKRGKHYATIEFNKLLGYADPYTGKYQGREDIIEYIPENALQGAINELKKEVELLKTESRNMQNIYLGVVALMLAIISILLVVK